jgi:hypothetical protein
MKSQNFNRNSRYIDDIKISDRLSNKGSVDETSADSRKIKNARAQNSFQLITESMRILKLVFRVSFGT